jgi:hypothetical protein
VLAKRLCLNEAMAKRPRPQEPNSVYFLKLLLYFVLGTIWIQINGHTILPLGLILGLVFTTHEHFQIDLKVEYVALLFAALIGLIGHGVYLAITL